MCVCGGLADDNARFLLLAIILTLYMIAGAALFQMLEEELELLQVEKYKRMYDDFQRYLINDTDSVECLNELLYAYGNVSLAGLINKRRRWDFPGSFHFVGTIVSTIGYGSTAPQTTAGKIAVILYGFFGCSGGILFFNLFLERIITFLAWVLRSLHLRRLKKRLRETTLASRRISRSEVNTRNSLPDILDDDDDALEHWKPSVYGVMFYLSIASCVVSCCAAAVYAPLEGWDYFEAIYFCFVSFATIGFGDYVSTQQPSYPYVHLYRFVNFIFLVIGCCCIYSLLNVTSIVIKQGLNYIITKIRRLFINNAAPHLPDRKPSISHVYRRRSTRIGKKYSIKSEDSISPDSRRMSGEMISMKDFLSSNKITLAVMQKQLYESAQMRDSVSHISSIQNHQPVLKPGAVGPLAIASEKF